MPDAAHRPHRRGTCTAGRSGDRGGTEVTGAVGPCSPTVTRCLRRGCSGSGTARTHVRLGGYLTEVVQLCPRGPYVDHVPNNASTVGLAAHFMHSELQKRLLKCSWVKGVAASNPAVPTSRTRHALNFHLLETLGALGLVHRLPTPSPNAWSSQNTSTYFMYRLLPFKRMERCR